MMSGWMASPFCDFPRETRHQGFLSRCNRTSRGPSVEKDIWSFLKETNEGMWSVLFPIRPSARAASERDDDFDQRPKIRLGAQPRSITHLRATVAAKYEPLCTAAIAYTPEATLDKLIAGFQMGDADGPLKNVNTEALLTLYGFAGSDKHSVSQGAVNKMFRTCSGYWHPDVAGEDAADEIKKRFILLGMIKPELLSRLDK
eukprot:Hpha_TRINITY_DN16504_c1_g1::TRINITY_DN16504_c1_g1_i1::g.135079::m.135079